MQFVTRTAEETKALAVRLAERMTGGELIMLEGELGAGKTTFVQGLAVGLGANLAANSPTFVIERRYPGRIELIHLDLYRVTDEREVSLFVRDSVSEAETVTAAEWSDRFPAVFAEYDAVKLSFTEIPEGREIEVTGTGPASEELLQGFV